jgi:hypothetical protein
VLLEAHLYLSPTAEGPSMGEPPEAPDPHAGARRDSWSLRTIVLDVSGHTLEEFQDPDRTPHPYLQAKPPPGARPRAVASEDREAAGAPAADDAPDRIYPPLVGAVARRLHGAEHMQHAPTLEGLAEIDRGGSPGRPGSPHRRPERVYLHYLLLHLDRLSDHALRYLRHAVEEELSHREGRAPPPD